MHHSQRRQTGLVFASSLAVSAGGFTVLSSLASGATPFSPFWCAAGAAVLLVGLALLMKAH